MLKKIISVLFSLIILAAPLDAYCAETGKKLSEPYPSTIAALELAEEDEGEWVKTKHSFVYVKGEKRLKGLQEIDGKTYFFNKKGIQRTGWQKIDGNYYFFKIANKGKGYMVKNKTVNSIKLNKDGSAKVTSSNRSKLNVLIKATKLVQKATKPDMKRSKKLRKCFDYTIKHYAYKGDPKFYYSSDWEVKYADAMFSKKHGSCYEYGAMFAFVANACGCKKCYAVSSGGHGWSNIEGKITDPSWHRIDKKNTYYQIDINLSGRNGRPNYKKNEKYKKRI